MAVDKRSKLQVDVGSVVGTLELLSTEELGGRRHWHCRCTTCGRERPIRHDHLQRYVGTNCHCVPSTRHGHSQEREFKIWSRMLDRCYKPKAANFKYYGGKGCYVCERWRMSYDSFLADIGRAPSDAHTLDRENSRGAYTCGKCDECKAKGQPANVRWATDEVQHRNQVSNRYFTHDGQTLILKDWARVSGIGYLTLHNRLERGWDFERAIKTPKLTTWSRGRRQNAKRKPNLPTSE